MNRKKLILCLLVLAFAGSLGYSLMHSPKEQRVATLKYKPGAVAAAPRKSAAAPAKAPDNSEVHLALLEQEQPRFAGYRRNIFSPIFHEEVKLPPFKPLPLPPRPAIPPPPPVPVPPPPPAPPTAEQIAARDLAKFTFLGFLKKDGEKTVFLSSNNEIFLAKRGSVLASRYQVSDLTDDAITIKSISAGTELVIPLIENRALSTRRTSTRNP